MISVYLEPAASSHVVHIGVWFECETGHYLLFLVLTFCQNLLGLIYFFVNMADPSELSFWTWHISESLKKFVSKLANQLECLNILWQVNRILEEVIFMEEVSVLNIWILWVSQPLLLIVKFVELLFSWLLDLVIIHSENPASILAILNTLLNSHAFSVNVILSVNLSLLLLEAIYCFLVKFAVEFDFLLLGSLLLDHLMNILFIRCLQLDPFTEVHFLHLFNISIYSVLDILLFTKLLIEGKIFFHGYLGRGLDWISTVCLKA